MIDEQHTAPVRANDRVSDVLARDESLVDVFIRQAPHFAKLRNRAMRKVMARLITVEQAARTANVSTERLVRELNEALGITAESRAAASSEHSNAAGTPAATHPPSAHVVELDVRDDLRSGHEPFSRIMSAVSTLANDDVLHLRAIFEPVPLFTVLSKRGFAHESKSHAADDWSVWFWRSSDVRAIPVGADVGQATPVVKRIDAVDDATTTHLDVRELTPPEPMMQTLAALETLSAGHTLLQINSRVPQFLFPVLAERGFAWEIDESQPDRVLVRISHAR
jgi:uncharacterized protein (DUF2249 family)